MQRALNLSEIEDSFFKSKNYSQKPEDSAYSGSQENSNVRKRGYSSTINMQEGDYNESNYAMNMMTPERVPATSAVRIDSDNTLGDHEQRKLQLTAAPAGVSQQLFNQENDDSLCNN